MIAKFYLESLKTGRLRIENGKPKGISQYLTSWKRFRRKKRPSKINLNKLKSIRSGRRERNKLRRRRKLKPEIRN